MILRRLFMIVVPVAVLALGAFAAITMIQNRPQPEQKPAEVPVPLVRVIKAKPEALRLKVHAEGTVAPKTVSALVPEVSGRVTWVSSDLATGGFFEEGEVLLKIDAREYELAIIRAQSAIAQAKPATATVRARARPLGAASPPPCSGGLPSA